MKQLVAYMVFFIYHDYFVCKYCYFNVSCFSAPKKNSIIHSTGTPPEELEITGYIRNIWKIAILWVLTILTLGIFRLILHWYPHWLLISTHSPVELEQAEKLLIQQNFQGNHKIFYVRTIITLDFMHFK